MKICVIYKKPDVDVMHEGYVRHHWLDYDETWRNDAFLQDIFTVTPTDTPITLTKGAMLGDPEENSIEGNVMFFSLFFWHFKGYSGCKVFLKRPKSQKSEG